MKKYLVKKKKPIIIIFVAMFIIIVTQSTNIFNNKGVEAISNPEIIEVNQQPAHSFIYKMGDEKDTDTSIENYEKVSRNQRHVLKEIKETREAEKLVQEAAELEAQKVFNKEEAETKEVTEVNQVAQNDVSYENKKVQPTQSSVSSNSSSRTTNSEKKSPSNSEQEAVHKAPTKTAPPKQSSPASKQESIGSNKIGINGTFKSYSNYGSVNTDQLQSGIDSGLIVAGLTNFNGNDGQTTYFGGHNPGIMKFIANSISVGSTITITDGNGQVHHYKMIDKVDVDEYGEGVLSSIGISAIEAYMYGTGTESILVQFCNTNNNLMSFWYGVKM